MSDQKHKPIRSAMRDEQRRLSEQAYPGDLAQETLQQRSEPSRLRLLRYPGLATALIGIGLTLAIALLPRHDKSTTPPGQMISVQPAPEATTKQQPSVAQTPPDPTPALPPVKVATTPLPEINRDLLPVSRNSKATWLASPQPHLAQIEKHTCLAANPNPDKRLRVAFSVPTRRSIDRSLSRTLTLKRTPKPGRTS